MGLRVFLEMQVCLARQLFVSLASAEEEETLVGGQAVVEGVMMRAPHSYCVAVRKPDGSIATEDRKLARVSERYPLFRHPVLRGLGTLGQAMSLGMKALRFSANAALDESHAGKEKKELSSGLLAVHLVLSLAFFIFLYKFVPLYLATALGRWMPVFSERIPFNLADGVIRMAIFVGFLVLISRSKDIHRVFEYHGAEHRVVFNFESGRPVTVENAQSFSTFHPRCGTSFLLVIMLVSIAVYTLLPFDSFLLKLVGRVALLPFDSFLLKLVGRVALLPLIAGLSYEAIRYASKHRGGLLATVTAPGLWLQRITTQPPAADQTEVAIRALDGAMALERDQGGALVIA